MKWLYLFLGILLAGCRLYSIDNHLLAEKKSPRGILIKLYYVGVGATANEVIQLRKVDEHGRELVVSSYEHNFLKSAEFVNGDTLKLVLADTTLYGTSEKVFTEKVCIH